MFQRALIRASVPFVFSNGFNPHPHVSIPFPRSVGTQSIGDRVCATVELSGEPPIEDWQDKIQQQLPAACSVLDVQSNLGKHTFHPYRVRYIFRLDLPFDQKHREHLNRCRKQLDKRIPIEIQRYWAKKRRYKQFDLAPYLEELDFSDNCIEVECGVSQAGTVRVDELMQWLNISPDCFSEPVCRTEIQWQKN